MINIYCENYSKLYSLNFFDAKDVKKLPKDKHSVKGVGKTIPNPEEWQVLADGVKDWS